MTIWSPITCAFAMLIIAMSISAKSIKVPSRQSIFSKRLFETSILQRRNVVDSEQSQQQDFGTIAHYKSSSSSQRSAAASSSSSSMQDLRDSSEYSKSANNEDLQLTASEEKYLSVSQSEEKRKNSIECKNNKCVHGICKPRCTKNDFCIQADSSKAKFYSCQCHLHRMGVYCDQICRDGPWQPEGPCGISGKRVEVSRPLPGFNDAACHKGALIKRRKSPCRRKPTVYRQGKVLARRKPKHVELSKKATYS